MTSKLWGRGPAALLLVIALAAGCNSVIDRRGAVEVDEVDLSRLGARPITLPNSLASVKFAVIGDSGRGTRQQREVAEQMTRLRTVFPFDFVVMLGDNIYEGPASREDYRRKFEEPYAELLDQGVEFYAVLGNHDDALEVHYAPFNMKGQRYYSFAPPGDVLARIATRIEFFALDTTNPDSTQLSWLNERLRKSDATWKICLSHHPLYTTGRYRNTSLIHRRLLEPLLVRHGVDVVFSGHEHIYQRSRLQHGIQYFVSGAAGSNRPGEGLPSPRIARTFATDLHFMLVEVERDELHFQAISRTGMTVDAGSLKKVAAADVSSAGTAGPR